MNDNLNLLTVKHDYDSKFLKTREDWYINHPKKAQTVPKKSKFEINPKWKKCFGGRGDDIA